VGHTLRVGVQAPSIHASEGPFLVHVVGGLGTVRIVQKLGTLRHLFGSFSTLISFHGVRVGFGGIVVERVGRINVRLLKYHQDGSQTGVHLRVFPVYLVSSNGDARVQHCFISSLNFTHSGPTSVQKYQSGRCGRPRKTGPRNDPTGAPE